MERTLIIVKPDGVQRGLTGEIIRRFEQRGLRIIGLRLMTMPRELAERHYEEHAGKGFYEGLVSYITRGPVVLMVLEGANAVALARQTIGKTCPVEADPGTIRGDLALEVGRNLVHGSDSADSGAREVANFFREDELVPGWARAIDTWLHE